MRTRVTALIVAVLIVAVGASPGHARTFGQMIDDATTVASVKGKLAADRLSNLWEIDVKASEGVVTLSGKVDTAEHRDRIAQIAGWASGVKSVVNNIQVTGAEATSAKAPTADSGRPTTSGTTNGATTIDVTGSVATKDPATGTLTLADGRVVRVTDATTIWQSGTLQALSPGAPVLIRDGAQAGLEGDASRPGASRPGASGPGASRPGDWRMGTVRRIVPATGELILADGSVVNVSPTTVVKRGTERLTLDALQPGWEIVIKAPAPPETATDGIDVVWAPTASAR